MIKQIAAPLQILSGAIEVLLRAHHAVVSSINWHEVEATMPPPASHKETHNQTTIKNLVFTVLRRFSVESICCVYVIMLKVPAKTCAC